MRDPVLDNILKRLNALERTRPRLRLGEVTGTAPLDVSLGAADTSYEDVATLGGDAQYIIGDQVAALLWGNDLLVLGQIGGLRIVRGIVTSAGGITEGTGFTISKGATGFFTINFSTAFSDVPAVVVTPETAADRGAAVYATTPPTASAAVIFTFDTSAATNADSAFHFIAVGPA